MLVLIRLPFNIFLFHGSWDRFKFKVGKVKDGPEYRMYLDLRRGARTYTYGQFILNVSIFPEGFKSGEYSGWSNT